MLFLCYPKCSTCQKARKWLDEHGLAYELRDIQQQNPSAEELRAWIARSGQPVRKFVNTSGLLYRAHNLKETLPSMSEEAQIQLLSTDGMLVKRPLLIGSDFVLIGFRPEQWAGQLL